MTESTPGPRTSRINAPRVSIGLPVYNGENYLQQSLDSLLRQSFTDFELIISDNASTDSTPDICTDYADRDSRVRYIRQDTNIGAAPNHNFVVHQARGELFKWASHDDLYHRELLRRCVQLLDADPTVVLAHSYDAIIDEDSRIIERPRYALATSSSSPITRFHSMLYGLGGNDVYGVVRLDVMRRTHLHGSYHNADRVIVSELALHGRFAQWPEILYYRRDHRQRAERMNPDASARAAFLDPRRTDQSHRQLYVDYVMGFAQAIETAPMTPPQRAGCYAELAGYLVSRALPFYRMKRINSPDPAFRSKAAESRLARTWARATGTRLPGPGQGVVDRLENRPMADLGAA